MGKKRHEEVKTLMRSSLRWVQEFTHWQPYFAIKEVQFQIINLIFALEFEVISCFL